MLKIKNIVMRNWMTVANAELVFPDAGFVHVVGRNNTGSKVSSIGSGKSALGDAVHRALFDVAGRFPYLRDYSRDEEGDTYVCVEGELHGKPLKVELGFKCDELSASGEGLRYTVGGTVVQMDSVRNTRAALTAALGIPSELAEWTVAVDGDRMKFGKLSQMNGVAVVMAALQQPPWGDYHDKCKRLSAKYEQDYSKAVASVSAQRAVVDQSKGDLEDAEQKLEELLSADVAHLKNDEERLKEAAAHHEQEISTNTKLIAKQAEDNARKRGDMEKERLAAQSACSALEDELERAKSAVTLKASLTSGTCGECGQPKPPPSRARIKEIKDKIKALDTQRSVAEISSEIRQQERIMDSKLSAMASLGLTETRAASRAIESAQSALRSVRNELSSVSSEIAAHDQKVAAARSAVAHCKQRLKEKKKLLEEAELEQTDAGMVTAFGDYWKAAFSPGGIPNMVLNRNIPALNQLADDVSRDLTGGLLKVEFSGAVELASGETRNKLNIKAVNLFGGPKVEGSSKGESGLINIVMAETMARVGGVIDKVRWRWFDEVINSQDPTVRASILSWLRNAGGLTFLVDHHAEIENYATHRLVACKNQRGITTYEWD